MLEVVYDPRVSSASCNILVLVLTRSSTNHGHHLCMPPFRIYVQTQRLTIDWKCKDHRHVLKRHCHLPGPKVERVCLRSPPIYKRRDLRCIQVWSGAGHQLEERKES